MAVPVFMMTEQLHRAGRTLVVGLGRTGLSVARYLAGHGVPVAIVDSRENPPGLAALRAELPVDVALFLGGFREEAFERAEQVVVSPGVPVTEPRIAAAAARGVPVIGDIELFARAVTAPVIAITGSNGKSTVTALVSAMAQQAGMCARTGGNIGVPALDLLGDSEPDLYILELSSFQLETTFSLRPRAAVVLNISADHLDRYPGLDAYAAAKQAVYRHTGLQVVNADDPLAARLADPQRPQVRYALRPPQGADEYGLRAAQGMQWLARGSENIMPVQQIGMSGNHNIFNALAALALGDAAGIPHEAMVDILHEFQGLPHRMQLVARRRGVCWYNDSKGTNPGATLAAIDGVQGKIVLIAGGDAKGADLSPLGSALQHKGRGAVLIGRDAPRLQELLQPAVPVERASDMDEAVALAAAMALEGDCVLLSPACASTDMYRDFQERGERFIRAVRELPA
jgi:UDP-N-acetylmuramoylalanine--D-glutamate ligase